ncbi:hypothetical protein ABPG74_004563 [Tetrahymena malaccensis]
MRVIQITKNNNFIFPNQTPSFEKRYYTQRQSESSSNMLFFQSSSLASSSISLSFSLVDYLTQGKIQFEYNEQLEQLFHDCQNEKIKQIHFCEVIVYDHKIRQQHQYIMLELKKEYPSYIKLEMCCHEKTKKIKMEQYNDKPGNVKYTYNTNSNLNLSDIIEYVQVKYMQQNYNFLYNEYSKFCYDIIQKFTPDTPNHKPLDQNKVIKIYFCESEIKMARGLLQHGFIIIKTEDDIILKCEIYGARNRVKLSFKVESIVPDYKFEATGIDNCTLGEIVKISDENWTNKTYQTISNNCFDYCKFFMRQFTSNTKNREQIEAYEKKNMGIGALVAAKGSVFAILGAELGAATVGSGGFLIGGILGFIGGVLCCVAVNKVVKSIQK